MGIANIIERNLDQTAVYWGNPVNDGYGDKTFDSPVEIQCRWEDRNEVFVAPNGDELIAKSIVYISQDVDEEGCLWLGTLDALYESDSAGVTIDPKDVEGAAIIKRFDKTPVLGSNSKFLRKVYLSSKNMV